MDADTCSIGDRIDDLARETGAPRTFVEQVRGLFSSKGIPLDADSGPYLGALREAFRREESIRRSTLTARENLARLRRQFSEIGSDYQKQVDRLNRIRESLEGQSRRLEASARRLKGHRPAIVLYSSDLRSFVTKPQSERIVMVPGPEEDQ